MKKKILIIVAALAVVIVIALIVLAANLEGIVNRNKDRLLARAESEIGRDISIGEVGVTIWGGLGVRLEDVVIADDPDFSDEPMLRAASVHVSVRFWPLLRKEVQVRHITLNAPVIRVIRDAGGVLNTTMHTPAGVPTGEPAPGGESRPPGNAAFAISLVNIKDGDLTFIDRAAGTELRIRQIESRVEDVEPTTPIKIRADAALFGEERNFRVEGTFGPLGEPVDVTALPVDATVGIDGIEFESLGPLLPAGALPPGLSATGPVSADIHVSGTVLNLAVEGNVELTGLALRKAGVFNKPANVPMTIAVNARYGGDLVTIERTTLRLHDFEAVVSGQYQMAETPTVDLAVRAESVPLSGWDAILPATGPMHLAGTASIDATVKGTLTPGTTPDVGGTASLRNAGMSLPTMLKPITNAGGDIRFTGSGADVTNATATVGSTKLKLTAKVLSFDPPTTTYRADADAIALDDFRPPNPNLKKPDVLRRATAEGRIEGERHTGKITSATGTVANLDYKSLRGEYDIVGKKAELSDVHIEMLDGTIGASGIVMLDPNEPSFALDTKIRGVNVIDLIEAIPGTARKFVKGRANLDLKLTGSGKEWTDIQKTLTGDGLAELFEGALVDVNILKRVVDELGRRTGQEQFISQRLTDKYPKAFKSADTAFENIKSDFVVANGRLLARHVNMDAGDYVMLGKGSIGLDHTVDLEVTMSLSTALSADLMKDVRQAKYLANEQGRIEVPFTLTGRLPKVTPGVDGDFINDVVRRALAGEAGHKLKDKVLDGIFGDRKKSAPEDTTSGGKQ